MAPALPPVVYTQHSEILEASTKDQPRHVYEVAPSRLPQASPEGLFRSSFILCLMPQSHHQVVPQVRSLFSKDANCLLWFSHGIFKLFFNWEIPWSLISVVSALCVLWIVAPPGMFGVCFSLWSVGLNQDNKWVSNSSDSQQWRVFPAFSFMNGANSSNFHAYSLQPLHIFSSVPLAIAHID